MENGLQGQLGQSYEAGYSAGVDYMANRDPVNRAIGAAFSVVILTAFAGIIATTFMAMRNDMKQEKNAKKPHAI